MQIAALAPPRRFSSTTSSATVLWTLLALLASVTLSGCNGCWGKPLAPRKAPDLDAALDTKKPEKPKPPFEPIKLMVLPDDDAEGNIRYIKPGHWTTAVIQTKANQADFVGDLAFLPLDQSLAPSLLDGTRFSLKVARPVSLPKGQEKFFEQLVYIPGGRSTTSVSVQLHDRRGGGEALRDSQVLTHLADCQYQLLVLSANPNEYRYLKVLDSVKPRNIDMLDADQVWYYHVCLPRAQKQAPVPGESLAWSSTSHLVWDDFDPQRFRSEQQQALIDWLHWGGHLIVSGPRSLDGLKGSFLEPYLPAASGGPLELDAGLLAPLATYWTRPDAGGASQPPAVERPWNGVRLVLAGSGRFLPETGPLVAERRVGRGRVLATAFRLSQSELVAWRSFDSFFNACLLARPARQFVERRTEVMETLWEGGDKNSRFDPQLVTHVRFFTRDATDRPVKSQAQQREEQELQSDINILTFPGSASAELRVNESRKQPGAAGWHDFNDVGNLARQSLRSAAGITIPDAQFVVRTLALYLLVVVPLNWLVFKVVGRVEWAWVAVPLLALIGAGAVVKLARLDIGFARSHNEIGILETQGEYPRGHLTRYTALYTSLATGYECQLSGAAAVLPFGRGTRQLRDETRGVVELRRDVDQRLGGFEVISNAADMLHSEQFVDLQQGFIWRTAPGEPAEVHNGTSLDLRGVVVTRRLGIADGSSEKETVLEWAWIGELAAGATAALQFSSDLAPLLADQLEESPLTQKLAARGALHLRDLYDLASGTLLDRGEVRLVGWTEQMLPGMAIRPAAAQVRQAMLVVAHLRPGDLAPPRPDALLPPVYLPPPEDDVLPLKPTAPSPGAAASPGALPSPGSSGAGAPTASTSHPTAVEHSGPAAAGAPAGPA